MHNQKFGKNVFGFGFGEEHHTIPLQFVVRLDKFLTRSNLFFRTEQTNKQTNKQTNNTNLQMDWSPVRNYSLPRLTN